MIVFNLMINVYTKTDRREPRDDDVIVSTSLMVRFRLRLDSYSLKVIVLKYLVNTNCYNLKVMLI